jgi:hypothetical protein
MNKEFSDRGYDILEDDCRHPAGVPLRSRAAEILNFEMLVLKKYE